VPFGREPESGARAVVSLRIDAAGGVVARARIRPDDVPLIGLLGLVLPAPEPPGPPVLGDADTLLHARFRPEGGVDLASLVPEDSQGDRLFGLRGQLFSSLVLDGTWETAIYLPDEGRGMPTFALALGHRAHGAALEAADAFTQALESSWPVHRSEIRFGEQPGFCFFDLALLPDLAPCYAVTDDAVIAAWNPDVLSRALNPGAADGEPTLGPRLGPEGGVLVHLGRLPEADERLRLVSAPDAAPADLTWAWELVRGSVSRAGDEFEVRVELEVTSGAGPASATAPATAPRAQGL